MSAYASVDDGGMVLAFYDDALQDPPKGAFLIADEVYRDWREFAGLRRWDATARALLRLEPKPLVPVSISRRQFFQALAVDEPPYITQAEALAAVKAGEIPAVLVAMVDALPEAERFAAEMLLSGATEFRRDHPLTATIGAAQGKAPGQIDDFFRFAATL